MLITLATGCASKDPDEVMATVNDKSVYRWEYELYYSQQLALYKQFTGIDLTEDKYKDDLATYKAARLEDLCESKAALIKAEEAGYGNLTQEQEAAAKAEYDKVVEQGIQTYIGKYTGDDARDKALKDYEKYIKSYGVTLEKLQAAMRDDYIVSLYLDDVIEESAITPTEEEVKEKYTTALAEQKSEYDEDPTKFESNTPSTILYVPEGYVRVTHIYLQVSDSYVSKLKTLDTELETKASAYSSAISDGKSDNDIQAAYNELLSTQELRTKTLEEGIAELKTTTDNIISQYKGGSDWTALVSEYNQDTAIGENGYYVSISSSKYYQDVLNAIFELKNTGDITNAIPSGYGVVIVRLEQIMEPGARAYEDVKDELYTSLRNSKIFSEQTRLKAEWFASMTVDMFTDKL
jgi:hypothetical protein